MLIGVNNMKIDFSQWFDDKKEEVCMGVELELFLLDTHTKRPLTDNDLLNDILGNVPYSVYRDYYPHQLEIRTDPFNNPDDVIKQTLDLYKSTSKVFEKHGIVIIPAPNITDDGKWMWCGMHVHLSYPNRKQVSPYWNKAMGIYPFILSLADHTKNFELDDIHIGERIKDSKHIGLPLLNKTEFLKGNDGARKYKDIILSNEINENNEGRHRLIKPETIEIRIFDTPSLVSTYETMIRYIFGVAQHIKLTNPMVEFISNNTSGAERALMNTRGYITNQRYGVNKILHKLNTDVCEDVCEYFKIPFDRETQFEFREKRGLHGNINGFLSSAIEGGWL